MSKKFGWYNSRPIVCLFQFVCALKLIFLILRSADLCGNMGVEMSNDIDVGLFSVLVSSHIS